MLYLDAAADIEVFPVVLSTEDGTGGCVLPFLVESMGETVRIVDMSGEGLPGDLVIWADVDCCFDSVDTERVGWGGLKSRYR